MDKSYLIPVRTMGLVALVIFLLGLINIGSTTAFNELVCLTVIGQYTSYLLSTTLLLMRKLGQKHVPLGPFQIGYPFGYLVNGFSMAFSVMVVILSVFPPYQPVSAQNLNYVSPVFGSVLLLSLASWFIFASRTYSGPVREVIENTNVRKLTQQA